MVVNVRHTGIVVSNLDESLAFYRDDLGFEIVKRMDESGIFIDTILGYDDINVTTIKMAIPGADNQMIELLCYKSHPEKKTSRKINDIGISHIAFTVKNLTDIYNALLQRGVKFISGPQLSDDGGVKVAFCMAPEGTYIELVELL